MNFRPFTAGSSGDQRRIRWPLILNYLLISSFTIFIENTEAIRSKIEKPAEVLYVSNLPNLDDARHTSYFSKFHAQGPEHEPLSYMHRSTFGLPSSFTKYSGHNLYSGNPPTVGNSPGSFNDSSKPPTSAESPSSIHLPGCCGPNMVNKRGTEECHCVYPVKVELYLLNVSLSSNWSDKFLGELASQLHLRLSQFEIVDFYVVGVSGLNITMNIIPHSGISFSDEEVKEMNASLTFHGVHIDGGYKLLNLTSFKPLAPSPAPMFMGAPTALPPVVSAVRNPSGDDNGGRGSNLVLLVGISVGSLIALLVIALAVVLWTLSKRKRRTDVQETAKSVMGAESISIEGSLRHPSSTRFLPYEELKDATNNFQPSSLLGEGGFGRVFMGRLADGTPVAIKKLTGGGHQGDKEFLVEVEMLSRLHHRNLVKLVGYYTCRDSSQHLLCYELVSNGSLENWLHGPRGINCPLDWDKRMRIALDAARGLAYLHEDSQPCVIHRDFKASNILLENDFHAKVSDFGLAKQAPEGRANYLSTRVMGTFGYVAPEYAMTGHLLVKSDVYSYGVVLLELLTGRKPVDMKQPSGQENLVSWARPILRDKERLEELADPRLEGNYPREDFLRVCTIAAACVAAESSQRPTMGEVVQSLKMVQRVTEPLPPQPSTAEGVSSSSSRPNLRQSSATFESDCTSCMFSSGPFSGLSLIDHENISRTGVVSEDLHEGR